MMEGISQGYKIEFKLEYIIQMYKLKQKNESPHFQIISYVNSRAPNMILKVGGKICLGALVVHSWRSGGVVDWLVSPGQSPGSQQHFRVF